MIWEVASGQRRSTLQKGTQRFHRGRCFQSRRALAVSRATDESDGIRAKAEGPDSLEKAINALSLAPDGIPPSGNGVSSLVGVRKKAGAAFWKARGAVFAGVLDSKLLAWMERSSSGTWPIGLAPGRL